MTETQERFLRAVLARVAADSVVELHLFPPIRRGTVETGVAVIATDLPPTPQLVVEDLVVDSEDVAEEAIVESHDAETSPYAPESSADAESAVVAEAAVDAAADATGDVTSDDDATSEDDVTSADDATRIDALADDTSTDADAPEPISAAPMQRLRILTASYRSTIKGPDRGKWNVEILDEAVAPRDAIEAVLRGVRHRSSEPADPELVSAAELQGLVEVVAVAPAA
jgi:hypothetical protein